jgi:hypothetical protein
MDTERFIREQIRSMLQEKTDSKPAPTSKSQPKAEPKTSGKRMGKTANKGKQSEQVANISALAKSNPGQLFSNLKISPSSITGASNREKANKVISQAFNSPEISLAFESSSVVGSEGEGWSVEVVVKSYEIDDADGEKKPAIPTGRAARYLGALFTAASNLGLIDFNPSDSQAVKHTPEAMKVYINLPV